MDFPSLKAQDLLRVLLRKPLSYRIVAQTGSHRKLNSEVYPPINFAWHDGVEIPPGAVRQLLCKRVGLSQRDALNVLKGKKL